MTSTADAPPTAITTAAATAALAAGLQHPAVRRVVAFAAELEALRVELSRLECGDDAPYLGLDSDAAILRQATQMVNDLRDLDALRARRLAPPEPRRELAQRVVDFVRRRPERHDQFTWFWGIELSDDSCGTTACLAGWTLLLDRPHDPTVSADALNAALSEVRTRVPIGSSHGYGDLAATALGLAPTAVLAREWLETRVWNRFNLISAIHNFAAALDVNPGHFDPALPLPIEA